MKLLRGEFSLSFSAPTHTIFVCGSLTDEQPLQDPTTTAMPTTECGVDQQSIGDESTIDTDDDDGGNKDADD